MRRNIFRDQSYMLQHGILHESSCVYRPTQNGAAERKNCHLLKVAHALLFQMTVPKPFWVNVVSATCFLINRMPSSVLVGNYSYSVLFPTKLLFPINPKIFGSTCFVQDTQPTIIKLDPKSLKCIFLRYSCIQNGYRCYSPQLHRSDLVREPSTQYVPNDAPNDASNDVSNDAPNDVSNDVPISAPSEAFGKSDAHSDAPSGSDSPSPSPTPEVDLPIALRKDKRTCRYLVSAFVSYDGLSTSSSIFVAKLDSILVPKTVGEALAHSRWRTAMIEEMNALDHNDTWALVDLPVHKKEISCKWVFSVKMNPDGLIARLKARLIAKSYVQTYGIDYSETFSSGEFGRVCKLKKVLYGLKQSPLCLVSKIYLDLLDDASQIEAKPCDETMIPKLKLRSEDGRLLHNHEKYRRVVGKLNYLIITHPGIAFLFSVVSQFLTAPRTSHWDVVTQIIGYLKGTPGLGILYANHGYHIAEGFTYDDYAGCPNTLGSTTRYCVFVGGNLVSWKIKKQNVVSRSSLEFEYRAMAQTTCEFVWLRNLLCEISFPQSKPMKMWCDNQAAIYIATNMVFHERTKHIEVDCHFTREKLEDRTITTPRIRTESQLADVLTKAFPRTRINSICNKLGMINIYAQLEGEC
nr:hypothetical protein [Tanacetum cinerariifolium]